MGNGGRGQGVMQGHMPGNKGWKLHPCQVPRQLVQPLRPNIFP